MAARGVMPAWGEPPRPGHHQDADRLRPRAGRRRVGDAVMSERHGMPDAHAACSGAERRGAGAALRAASRSIRRRSHGRCRRIKWVMLVALPRRSITSRPGCAGTAARTRPTRRCWSISPTARFYFFCHRDLAAGGLLPHRPADARRASALFLVTALFGRVWCGYACPQTVWTDLFMRVERLIEGDRNARMKLDAAPWSLDKVWRKSRQARGLAGHRRRPPAAPGSSTSTTRRR